MGAAERKEVLNLPLKNIFDVVIDVEAYPQFVTGMKKAQIRGEGADGKKVEFELEMMKRINYTIVLNSQLSPDGQSAKVWWKLDSSDAMKVNNGTWELKSLGSDKTEVTYKLELELNFPVPGFIMKGLVANSLPTAIKEFATRAGNRKA